jgi:hypothetical protein
MNSKIKGSQMPFDQDIDDDDTAQNDMGSVVENNRVSKPAAEETKPTTDSNAFKKAKPVEKPNGKSTNPVK